MRPIRVTHIATATIAFHFPFSAWFPLEQQSSWLRDVYLSASPAPGSLDYIYPLMCGSCSNENAVKMIFQRYMHEKRVRETGKEEFSADELAAAMRGEGPKLSILTFGGGFHGRTIGMLSCSNSR